MSLIYLLSIQSLPSVYRFLSFLPIPLFTDQMCIRYPDACAFSDIDTTSQLQMEDGVCFPSGGSAL